MCFLAGVLLCHWCCCQSLDPESSQSWSGSPFGILICKSLQPQVMDQQEPVWTCLSPSQLLWVMYICRFACVETSLHPSDEAHLVMTYDLFDDFLNSILPYYIKHFCSVWRFPYTCGFVVFICLFGGIFVCFGGSWRSE